MKGHPLFAASYDWCMQYAEAQLFRPLREHVVGEASGRVLEIGAGTGVSFPYYRVGQGLVGTEPDPFMVPRALKRARALGLAVALVQCPAEELPFADCSFDTVVSTLVLCTVEDPTRSLAEIRRVLKPGGSLRFIEHVRFEGIRGSFQDLVAPVWGWLTAGCQPNRRTVDSIRAAGFETSELHWTTPILPFATGVAVPC
jgi:ubiquinone/menaquinone biosynthesis C-methylase UbiE